jgi:hypothetical protein
MKVFIMAGILLLLASPYKCAEENEEGENTETNETGYEAQDAEARLAIADWEKFLAESDSIIDKACAKISQATDKLENENVSHKGRLKLAIINANGRMEKLSDMLLAAKKIKPGNYKFDTLTLQKIQVFEQDFKTEQEKLDKALKEL